jgi:NitT/TauT family transport system ATP-binding protein
MELWDRMDSNGGAVTAEPCGFADAKGTDESLRMSAQANPLTQPPEAASAGERAPFLLHFRGVAKSFRIAGPKGSNELLAVRDVELGVRQGEVVAVIGPSGCGKSTLLSLGAGLDRPSAGKVTLAGEEITKPDLSVAFMLQKDLLLPWRTIQHNVEYGLELRGMPRRERRERARGLLDRFGLAGFVHAYPHQLSGGMRQRAALARTMALEPRILLLDEPFSALDAQTKMNLQEELARAVKSAGATTIFITHDLTEAVVLADRIYVMSERPGTVVKEIEVDLPFRGDPVERYFHPSTVKYVREIWSVLSHP